MSEVRGQRAEDGGQRTEGRELGSGFGKDGMMGLGLGCWRMRIRLRDAEAVA